jgi:hypothetical protein
MTFTKEEAEKYAQELVNLSVELEQIKERIKGIKGGLLEWSDIEGLSNHVWQVDNGYVQIETNTKYKLVDVPATVEIDSAANVPVDVAEKAFKSKVTLTKEGKKMFEEGYESIRKLMVPNDKKEIKVVV